MDQRDITQLEEWTGTRITSVLYDTETDEVSSRCINTRIRGRSNLAIVVVTGEGYVFGSFHPDLITFAEDKFYGRYRQHNGFIFTLKNPRGVPPERFFPTKQGDYLVVYSAESDARLIAMSESYSVTKTSCSISPSFDWTYNSYHVGDVFLGDIQPNTHPLAQLIIFQCTK